MVLVVSGHPLVELSLRLVGTDLACKLSLNVNTARCLSLDACYNISYGAMIKMTTHTKNNEEHFKRPGPTLIIVGDRTR